jgi:hypothetical protein
MNAEERTRQKRVKEILQSEYDDKITLHRDGTVSVKRTFFYRHGQTSQSVAQSIVGLLQQNGLKVETEAEEHWNSWPKDSYWLVRIRNIESPDEE